MRDTSLKGKRIFWLGMHKILVQTELVRLRELGYEVFNPAYLSNVQDQSAELNWDAGQPTTLPKEVFQKLSRYNFFYNDIAPEIADILNSYFDAVVVTISPIWLASVMKAFHGRLIFRTYGQHGSLCDDLRKQGLLVEIAARKNFSFVPHAAEALKGEHAWLKERATVVPYCLPQDIFNHTGTWHGPSSQETAEIAITCPNLTNAFFKTHYDFLKRNFHQSHFKYFGVQLSAVNDSQVVGTLPRSELIARFKSASGYLYTYTDSRVCYLPPIEMMVLGGPVLFLRGSLLDSYFGPDAPGRCEDISEAHEKVSRLIAGDRVFITAVLASQAEVVRRYHPNYVWPVFDAFFSSLFDREIAPHAWLSKSPEKINPQIERIYLLHHFPGQPIVFDGTNYSAYDGIPRVMRQITRALHLSRSTELIITARLDQAEATHGFFSSCTPDHIKVRILAVDDSPPRRPSPNLKEMVKKVVPARYRAKARNIADIIYRLAKSFRISSTQAAITASNTIKYIETVNSDENCRYVIVPHYYCFPEALNLIKDIYLYLPDYMPHFFHKTGEFRGDEGVNTDIGKAIANKARVVFCNSEFTRSYLPQSRLAVAPNKIRVFYLPLLNTTTPTTSSTEGIPPVRSGGYIFYPTQPRPNKNLSLLLKIFDSLVQHGHDLSLILTCRLEPDPKALSAFQCMAHAERVIFMPHVSDELLSNLYRHAELLCFTSLAEGNFPPQILEALAYDTPIVASNLGFVTERLPTQMPDALLLCKANDLDAYVNACEFVLGNRALVVDQQRRLKKILLLDDARQFEKDVASVFI